MILNITKLGEEVLRQKAEPVPEVNDEIRKLADDMLETMIDADGVGLAAPQVGILKKIAVIDVTEDRSNPIILINPVIVKTEGEQRGSEGCLSVPDKIGIVTRPKKVKVKALDINMKPITIKGEDLLARAMVHEIEHLDGHLYTEKVEGKLYTLEEFQEEFGQEEE